MDPGNWITSMQGGAQWLYFAIRNSYFKFISNVTSKHDSEIRIATGMDLAQMTRHYLSRPIAIIFWIIAELAIIATDIAEVIGSAIALNLLFNIPLIVGALNCT